MQLDCWAYDGTNESACLNNQQGMECTWIDEYDEEAYNYPCMGPPEKGCWNKQTEAACTNITGCKWGMCMKKSCWDYSNTNQATCETQVGFNGKSCKWEIQSWGTECMEGGCWNYGDSPTCIANGCRWQGSHCEEIWCGSFSGTNADSCVNNTVNLSCNWDNDGGWCNDQGCWNYNQNDCGNTPSCFWETYDGGWCEELWCWNWDGNLAGCENASLHPGLSCVYENNWCYENVSAKGCSDITMERDCLDTFYCWWNYSATTSTCNDPVEGVIEDVFEEWNPGCFIFDMEQEICGNTTGCYWSTTFNDCENNDTILPDNELNCSSLDNQTVCNDISALSTCCKWQAGECVADRFDQSCREQMQEPPEGAYYCEDYNSYTDQTLCEQIAGNPWFMPCKWNNNTERCEFNGDDIFTDGEKNIMKIDNEKNCEAAGGKWILDTYPSSDDPDTAVRLSLGRCDFKFDEERNCNKECYACEYKFDKTNWSSTAKAKEACIESELGICGFTADSSALNGWGYCEPKTEFRDGLTGGDCDADCGACTYYGDPAASEGKKPSDYCDTSKAKCKWALDPAHPDDESYGRCVSKSEKTCDDKCDKCYDESSCKKYGAKDGDTTAEAECEWDDGVCKYKSGASEMEVCWDGVDNNGDNKIDCADSMCWSDAFCGGEFMFDGFGKDCFIYDNNQTQCENEGCAWINETWGSWCDMPGAVCWKKDGTNETYCEVDGSCEWHSGFGGFCEQDWEMGSSCFVYDNNQTACNSHLTDQNCTWVVDNWCQDVGGWCESNPSYTGTWVDCWQYMSQLTCGTATGCQWQQDQWCQDQGDNPGFCDHKSFACWQFTDRNNCEETTNSTFNHSLWCTWKNDEYSPEGGWCEGKMMSTSSGGGCWDNSDEAACEGAGCNWMAGFCDPQGFGGDSMPGMSSGGGSECGGMGGFGMQCFKYDGNQTACENETGCGWFNEPMPFCDINFKSNCPQYTYNRTVCETQESCKWNPTGGGFMGGDSGFCDEKPFECFWNTTLRDNQTLCNTHSLCYWSNDPYDNHCHPIGFNATTEQQCTNYGSSFRWITGWCSPAMAAEFFSGMEMGGPPIPLGIDADDGDIEDEVDIIEFGMKDMGNAYGFGITVDDPQNSAACNDVKMSSGTGTGENRTKFYWYFDTDGETSGSCSLKHDSNLGGYEFYLKNDWSYDSASGSVTESPAAYRCSEGEWILAEIRVTSQRQMMCSKVGGVMVATEKTELEKFPSLYSAGIDIRVAVASADTSHNVSDPSDTASPGWVSPGTQDFELPDLYEYESDATKKAAKEAAGSGFIEYGKDADCWTETGCADYSCKGHPYCVDHQYGVEGAGWTDTRVPKVVGVIKETYPDSAFFAFFTDKPANGTLLLYGNNSICTETALTDTVYDVGVTSSNSREYKLWHVAELYNDGGVESLNYPLISGTTYHYKLKVCDDSEKCGVSKCSNFTTPTSVADCSFCKFVSRIDAPTGWNVYYDLGTDGTYDHWQGHILGPEDGMFTNYTTGRRVNILMNTTDGTAHMEFFNATLTKTGMGPKIRDINDRSDALKEGTTTDSAGNTIGYTGMIEDTRDKIIYNLYPMVCQIMIPKGDGDCSELWHCNSSGGNCVDRTTNATLLNNTSVSCVWKIPYCEFSIWASGEPGTQQSGGDDDEGSSGGGSGGGGGGGGGAVSGLTYIVREDKFKEGYTKELAVGDKFKFVVEGGIHYLNLTNVMTTKVMISVESEPQKASLLEGETKKFEVTGDNYNDLTVKVNRINATGGKASLTVKSIHELISKETTPVEEVIGEAPAEASQEAAPSEMAEGDSITGVAVAEEAEGKVTWIWFVLAGIVVVVIVFLILYGKKK